MSTSSPESAVPPSFSAPALGFSDPVPEFADVAPECDAPSPFAFPLPFPLVDRGGAGNVSIASAWSIKAMCV